MPNRWKAYIKGRIDVLRWRVSKIVPKLNYKGEHFFQSKVFLCGVSVLISVILWTLVAFDGNSDASRTLSVDIKYINLARGMSLFTLDNKVEVKLEGRMSALSGIQASDIAAEVDLANLAPGKYSLPMKFEAPSFARVRSWRPALVELEIYRHVERVLPVEPKLEGAAPDGMVVSSVDIDPKEAVVSGPDSDVLSVQKLELPIALDKLDANGGGTFGIEIRAASGNQSGTSLKRLALSPSSASAKVSFENEIVGERIPVKVSVVGQPQEGLQVESIKVIPDSVSIRGSSSSVRNMQSLVLPPVDISGLEQNIQLVIPMQPADMPSDVEITGTDRARVEIRLSKKMGVKTYTNVPLMIDGGAPGSEWKVIPSAVSVTIEGPQLSIDSLSSFSTPCELYIDVSNIVSDRLELPVLARNLKRDFQIVKIEPEQVLVTNVE